tara:strand:+ start:3272 stop:3505 length:234 start_codon:yes stop_codon:yes gene_type:complete
MGAIKQLESEKYYLVQYDNKKISFFFKKYLDMKEEYFYFGQEIPYANFQDYIDSNKKYLNNEYWNEYFKKLRGNILN